MVLLSQSAMMRFLAILEKKGVAADTHPHYLKWLRYYLDFCAKYAGSATDSERMRLFLAKLREKNRRRTPDARLRTPYPCLSKWEKACALRKNLPEKARLRGSRWLHRFSRPPLHGAYRSIANPDMS